MNKILNHMYKVKPNYCHIVEVGSVYQLECIYENVLMEFKDEVKSEDLTEFFSSLTVIALNEENAEEIYNFDFETLIGV